MGIRMTGMGIVSTGTYFPDTYVTAAEIARQSGLPVIETSTCICWRRTRTFLPK